MFGKVPSGQVVSAQVPSGCRNTEPEVVSYLQVRQLLASGPSQDAHVWYQSSHVKSAVSY